MKILPSVETPDWNDDAVRVAKENGFLLTSLVAKKLVNGFICVTVDWDGNHLFKYATLESTAFGLDKKFMTLQFEGAKYTIPSEKDHVFNYTIEIGLETDDQSQLRYEPLFFQNTKYGVQVYFGPNDWDTEKGAEILFDSREDKSCLYLR